MFELHDARLRLPEILAPAGGRAQFMAALNAGADAVYLGLNRFNARARAENFSVDDLRELVPLAHSYGMQVLVAVNILIKEAELSDLVETLSALEEIGVDAIIVQDIAVAALARKYFPGLRLHASTQLAVHNASGVQQAVDLGFRRVVLARELTALEMRKIREKFPREVVELEAFCHGSLCYSYSGLCFFSGANDARSGNRGECAYTCRQPYKIVSEPGAGFLFSMRDLDTADSLKAFFDAGIDTLKIEGRKKDAQYVSSVVRLYRQKMAEIAGLQSLRESAPKVAHEMLGEATESAIREDLNFSFQRESTSFFFKGRYHENVIDLANPTHKGIKAGSVLSCSKAAGDTWVRFLARRSFERFDGVRIEIDSSALRDRYENETCSFSLREFKVGGVPATQARAGDVVEARIPAGVVRGDLLRAIEAGQTVYKTRSNDLKRRVEALSQIPAGARVRPLIPLDIRLSVVDAGGGRISITALASRFGEEVCRAAVDCGHEPVKNVANMGALDRDLVQMFSVIEGFACPGGPVIENPVRDAFVPRQILKYLKRALLTELEIKWDQFIAARKKRAFANFLVHDGASLGAKKSSAKTVESSEKKFAVKIDRLEYLDVLREFSFAIDEVVFEPKRAFLATPSPADFIAPLMRFSDETGVKIRFGMPVVIRAWDEPLLKVWATAAAAAGVTAWEVGNAGAPALLRAWGITTGDVSSDFTLYALNHVASGEIARILGSPGKEGEGESAVRVTLSVEDDLQNIRRHLASAADRREGKIDFQQILYKDTPLFIAESCSLTALHNGCPTAKVCGYRTLEVENPSGERFFVAHESCKSIVYGHAAWSVTQNLSDFAQMGIRHFRVDFLTRPYSPDHMRNILQSAFYGVAIPDTHDANLTRELL
jgi:putative protease